MRKTDERLKQEVTGKWLRGCYMWLVKEGDGCCHIVFGESGTHQVCVCVGWTAVGPKEYKVAWKIGWQTFDNAMQTDLDLDFDMPWNTKEYCDRKNAELKAKGEYSEHNRYVEGDVYDTQEILELKKGRTTPQGYRDWNALAAFIRKTARKVLAYAKEVDSWLPSQPRLDEPCNDYNPSRRSIYACLIDWRRKRPKDKETP